MISFNFYLFLHIAANQRNQTAEQQCSFCSAVCSHGMSFSDTCVMLKSVVRIACAYSVGLLVFQQNGSCLHFRVYRVSVGASSQVPYCRTLNMAQCKVQCSDAAINEVMYLLLGKNFTGNPVWILAWTTLLSFNIEKFGYQRFNACCLDLNVVFMGVLTTCYLINLCRQKTLSFRFFCCGFQECNPNIKQGCTVMGNVNNERN